MCHVWDLLQELVPATSPCDKSFRVLDLKDLAGSLQNPWGFKRGYYEGFKRSFKGSCRILARCFSIFPSQWSLQVRSLTVGCMRICAHEIIQDPCWPLKIKRKDPEGSFNFFSILKKVPLQECSTLMSLLADVQLLKWSWTKNGTISKWSLCYLYYSEITPTKATQQTSVQISKWKPWMLTTFYKK